MACSGCTGFSVTLPQLAAGSFSSAPIHGVVASLLTVRRGPQPKDSEEKSAPAKAASTAFKCNKALTKNSNDTGLSRRPWTLMEPRFRLHLFALCAGRYHEPSW